MSVKENFLRKSKSLAFHVADDEYSRETINYVGTGKDENLNHVRAEETESSQPQTVDKAKVHFEYYEIGNGKCVLLCSSWTRNEGN